MNQIKLTEKQASALSQIQAQKAELTKMFSGLNEKEAFIIELVFDGKEDLALISNIQLKDGHLTYDLAKKEEKPQPNKKGKKAAPEPAKS